MCKPPPLSPMGRKRSLEPPAPEVKSAVAQTAPAAKRPKDDKAAVSAEAIPYFTALATFLSYGQLIVVGYIWDFILYTVLRRQRDSSHAVGYAPLTRDFEDFYTRNLYHRISDCWNRPVCSAPGAWFDVVAREAPADAGKRSWPPELKHTGETIRALNLGSYNYLGFAAADEYCTPRVVDTLKARGAATCAPRAGGGTTDDHLELERLIAEYLGKEAAVTLGMGFATNSLIIPALVSKGCLVVSDSLNHNSIVKGCSGSGAKVKVFRHNEPDHLDRVLHRAIAEGQPRTGRPWKKVLVVVEGIYSMEGEVCRLKEIVAIKKKYRAYLYLDEAHSIGAVGATGRGISELQGVDTADIDIMMGTFTKSFGSCGGYIASSRAVVNHLRAHSPAHLYATAMSPPCVRQCIASLQVIMGADGSDRGAQKLAAIREGANFLRTELEAHGCIVLGDKDSPVLPVMLFNPGKISAFSRECLARGVAVVVVGFPACPLLLSRVRLCVSAAHSKEDLKHAAAVLKEVADIVGVTYGDADKKRLMEANPEVAKCLAQEAR